MLDNGNPDCDPPNKMKRTKRCTCEFLRTNKGAIPLFCETLPAKSTTYKQYEALLTLLTNISPSKMTRFVTISMDWYKRC